jgi:hypothetical protein
MDLGSIVGSPLRTDLKGFSLSKSWEKNSIFQFRSNLTAFFHSSLVVVIIFVPILHSLKITGIFAAFIPFEIFSKGTFFTIIGGGFLFLAPFRADDPLGMTGGIVDLRCGGFAGVAFESIEHVPEDWVDDVNDADDGVDDDDEPDRVLRERAESERTLRFGLLLSATDSLADDWVISSVFFFLGLCRFRPLPFPMALGARYVSVRFSLITTLLYIYEPLWSTHLCKNTTVSNERSGSTE